MIPTLAASGIGFCLFQAMIGPELPFDNSTGLLFDDQKVRDPVVSMHYVALPPRRVAT
ncbi:MAG: hypothetical protein IPM29_00410 [Planctomycetes bacterium]|nr:hypothetical protein [Planctomycetota bacterium]